VRSRLPVIIGVLTWNVCFQALEMVRDIEDAFTDIVRDLQWMDELTKSRTLDKVREMRPFIGFPEWLLTPGQLEKYFQGVSVFQERIPTKLYDELFQQKLWTITNHRHI